jgi:tripartite motif-containing protein 2/3
LVTSYHPDDKILPEIVHANWDLLGKGLATSFIHQDRPLIAFSRPPNLRDLLVKADISHKPKGKAIKTETQPNIITNVPSESKLRQTSITSFLVPTNTVGNNPTPAAGAKAPANSQNKERLKKHKVCTNPNCRYCPFLNKNGTIECHLTGQTYSCKENVTCQSSNLIYGIGCKRCGKHYVGQTKRAIYQRLQEHLRSITQCCSERSANFKPQPVGLHFSAIDHQGTKDVQIQILDFVHLHPDSKKAEEIRLRVEKRWIHRLRCPAPHGMNIFD